MKFTVDHEFQHKGITYEVGNKHRKHGLSDEDVQSFYDAGWVSLDDQKDIQVGDVVVQPDDMKINFNVGESYE